MSFVAFHALLELQVNIQGASAVLAYLLRNIALIAAGALACFAALRLFTEAIVATAPNFQDAPDAHLTRLIGNVAAYAAALAAVVYGLGTIGIPAAGLVTGIGIGGIGLAFAARSTVENLFGGVVVLADKPFRIGDTIGFDGETGQVLDIGMRSCRIRRADGAILTVPNAALSARAITIFTQRGLYPIRHRIRMPLRTPVETVESELGAVRRELAAGGDGPGAVLDARVALTKLDGDAIELEISGAMPAESERAFLEAQEAVLRRLLSRLGEAAVPG